MSVRKNVSIVLIGLYLISCSHAETYPLTDHYDGKVFTNQNKEIEPKGFKDLLKWWLTTKKEKWPDEVSPPVKPIKPIQVNPAGSMIATFVNHATYLVQMDGLNILLDPVWSERVSPLSFAGPKRVHAPGVRFEDLPAIDVVFISHNHYDHMDSETINKLSEKFNPLFIVALKNKKTVEKFGAKKVIELDWWQEHVIDKKTAFIMTPVQHWSSRTPFDKREALWGGLFVKGSKNSFFFGGDTGYGPHFKDIFKKYGEVSLALLPIGAYEPRWFMKDVHMNPEDAVLAHQDLNAKYSLGMHYGTFQLTNEGIETPVQDLEMAKLKHKVFNFSILRAGEQQTFD